MAITPRTILTNAAPATVAIACLYIFTFLGLAAYKTVDNAKKADSTRYYASVIYDSEPSYYTVRVNVCDTFIDTFGPDRSLWSESAWAIYATCYEQRQRYRRSLSIVSQGLHYYPSSEALHNMKGYYLILLEEYDRAIVSLEDAKRRIPNMQSGILANNLAWAGLWAPRTMSLDRARDLYKESLKLSPNVCETIHTGLWVEYAHYKRSSSDDERTQALAALTDLRKQYQSCLSPHRISKNDPNTLIEIAGAFVIFQDAGLMTPFATQSTLRKHVAHQLASATINLDANALCSQAIPMADMHHRCVEQIEYLGRSAQLERPGCPSADMRLR